MRNCIIASLCFLSVLSIKAEAKIVNPANINIVFSGNTKQISRVWVESQTMLCAGESSTAYPYGYIYNGSSYDGKDTISLSISGPYDGDGRNICKIYYDDGSYDRVYFILNNLRISYIRNYVKYTCNVKEGVGLGYDSSMMSNNKLQGQDKKLIESCVSDISSQDTYVIIPGKWKYPRYNAGQITINLK